MLILIAESKTMGNCNTPISTEEYSSHRAETDSIATTLSREWAQWSVDETASKIGISPAMARAMHQYMYDFPNKSVGGKAITAFNGVVFKALDYNSLTEDQKIEVQRKVRIISSLYGILKPDDIIKPYRLDFTTKVSPTGQPMATYWKPTVTGILRDALRETGCTEILDLMPGDAAKCIDWRGVGVDVKRIKVTFKQISASENGDGQLIYKTPMANRLKTLRGKLLRQIITAGIDSAEGLKSLEGTDYQYDEEMSSDTNLVFITE